MAVVLPEGFEAVLRRASDHLIDRGRLFGERPDVHDLHRTAFVEGFEPYPVQHGRVLLLPWILAGLLEEFPDHRFRLHDPGGEIQGVFVRAVNFT